MAWEESKFWLDGSENMLKYQETLHEALTADERNSKRKKVVHPNEMPWELAPQGILKHLINEQMNTRMETVDEECLYVLEGYGYDLHQDCDVEITDTYHWKAQEEVKKFEWEAGDVIYIPPNTIHQHFNGDPDRPARLISATNRVYSMCGLNDLEQLENAPEYVPDTNIDAEWVRRLIAEKVNA